VGQNDAGIRNFGLARILLNYSKAAGWWM
jgi:hypothetical protein